MKITKELKMQALELIETYQDVFVEHLSFNKTQYSKQTPSTYTS